MQKSGYNVQTGAEVLKHSERASRCSASTSPTNRIHLVKADARWTQKTRIVTLSSKADPALMIHNHDGGTTIAFTLAGKVSQGKYIKSALSNKSEAKM